MATGSRERANGALRDLETVPLVPSTRAELIGGRFEVGDPIDEDRPVALEMVGQQDARRSVGQVDHRHPGAHPVDREDDAATEDVGEVRHVGRDVATGHVHVVERLEHVTAAYAAGVAVSVLPDVAGSPVTADRRVEIECRRRRSRQDHDETVLVGCPTVPSAVRRAVGPRHVTQPSRS